MMKKMTMASALLLISSFSLFSCVHHTPGKKLPPRITVENSFSTTFDDQTQDGVIATIQDKAILFSDLQSQIRAVSQNKTTLLPTGELRGGAIKPTDATHILNILIDQAILEAKAKEWNISVRDDELESRLDQFLKRQNITEEQLKNELQLEHISYHSYKENFRREIMKQELIGRVIAPKTSVTVDEVRSFYRNALAQSKNRDQVQLRNLIISMSQKKAFSKIKSVEKMIDHKVPFSKIVKRYSEASNVDTQQGVLPFRNISELPPALQSQLISKEKGDVFGPLEIGNTTFFFEVMDFTYFKPDESRFLNNYEKWKQQYQQKKFALELERYLSQERKKYDVSERDLHFYRTPL